MQKENTLNYIEKQFLELSEEKDCYKFSEFTSVKFQNENGQTNYLNVSSDKLLKIMQLLKD